MMIKITPAIFVLTATHAVKPEVFLNSFITVAAYSLQLNLDESIMIKKHLA